MFEIEEFLVKHRDIVLIFQPDEFFEGIGSFAYGRNHHHQGLATIFFHQRNYSVYSGCIFHQCAAKFKYPHHDLCDWFLKQIPACSISFL